MEFKSCGTLYPNEAIHGVGFVRQFNATERVVDILRSIVLLRQILRPKCGKVHQRRPSGFDLFASLMEFDLKDIFVILEIRVACKDGPAAS